ncbi:MAG: hypothetical protein II501_00280 [Clostridia bacterium]|nr:hypothetical protein [Clostridia bacterium]
MNNSDIDLSKLPKFVYIFLIALVAGILFWAFIGSALLRDAPEMQEAHDETVRLVNKYDTAMEQKDTIEKEIKRNNEEFEKKQKELFIDVDTCSKELEQYFKDNGIKLDTYALSAPVADSLKRVSSSGYPVYSTDLSIAYKDTYEKTLAFLKYIEKQTKGCYYVKSCAFKPDDAAKTGDVSISVTLYYYNTDEVATQAPTQAATTK